MNALALVTPQTWELVGWTMCYFLVVGTALTLVGALLRWMLRRAAPQVRYATSLLVFAVLALLPLVIAGWLLQFPSAQPQALATEALPPTPRIIDLKSNPALLPRDELSVPTAGESTFPLVAAQEHMDSVIATEHGNQAVGNVKWQTLIQYLPWLWLFGTPLTFVLLGTGLIGSQRLRRQSQPLTAGLLQETCARLCKSLTITRDVRIAIHDHIATPLLIGIVRPMILLPPAAVTGWSPEQVEMVLLHELAHVHRWDNLVNFLQRVVESLLFFHPCVWWVSGWVRRDREECVDAVVVNHTSQPHAYAELLVAMASQRCMSKTPITALALAEHPLAHRIRRILNLEDEKMLVTRSTVGWLGLVVAALLAVAIWQPTTKTIAEEKPVELVEEKAVEKEKIENAEVAESAENKASRVDAASKSDAENSTSPFLTLEDQRAADLAYKMLGLELEPLSEHELERVKKMGFDGGLRVAHTDMSRKGITSMQSVAMPGDLLVGLHVWPTTSLADAKIILERDDLGEFSPLKFYAVRGKTNNLEQWIEDSDQRISGRISVNTDAIKPQPTHIPDGTPRVYIAPPRNGPATPTSPRPWPGVGASPNEPQPVIEPYYPPQVIIDPSPAQYSEPRTAVPTTEPRPLSPSAPAEFDVVLPAPSKVPDQDTLIEMLKNKLTQVRQELPLLERKKELAILNQEDPFGQEDLESQIQKLKAGERSLIAQLDRLQKAKSQDESNTSTLLYDNKTFDQWRSLWRRELSLKQRTEAVRAMAAFANAGHGKAAAAEILEIAGEYDWRNIDSTTEEMNLQRLCLSAFGSLEYERMTQSLRKENVEAVIVESIDSKNIRARAFLVWLIPKLREQTDATKRAYKQLQADKELAKYLGYEVSDFDKFGRRAQADGEDEGLSGGEYGGEHE